MGGHGTGIRYSDIALNPLNSLNQISLSVVAIPYAPCHLVQKKVKNHYFLCEKNTNPSSVVGPGSVFIRFKFLTQPWIRIKIGPKFWVRIKAQCVEPGHQHQRAQLRLVANRHQDHQDRADQVLDHLQTQTRQHHLGSSQQPVFRLRIRMERYGSGLFLRAYLCSIPLQKVLL